MNLQSAEWKTCTNELCHTYERVTFIGKVVNICLGVSVNLVYKSKGKPGTTTVKHDFNHLGLKFHRGSPWVSVLSWLNLNANKDYFSYEHMNESCHELNESCRDTYEWIISRTQWVMLSHIKVVPHIWTNPSPLPGLLDVHNEWVMPPCHTSRRPGRRRDRRTYHVGR